MRIEERRVEAPAIAVHGGAGDWRLGEAEAARYRKALEDALEAGYSLLSRGGSSLDAVEEAVAVLEDSGLFNAGSGACLNAKGYAELDAGIMYGPTMKAGSVAGVRGFGNPVRLARLVLENTSHVIMCCGGAEELAKVLGRALKGLRQPEAVGKRYRELLESLRSSGEVPAYVRANSKILEKLLPGDTVGAVAIDSSGALAAATSTGGIWLKLPGRVGDSPIPGAGFYADREVACSSTGIGEAIMTVSLCRSTAVLYRLTGSLSNALEGVFKELEALEAYRGYAQAGAIVMTRNLLAVAYNTRGMARGHLSKDSGKPVSAVP